jgi:hypothetical protein
MRAGATFLAALAALAVGAAACGRSTDAPAAGTAMRASTVVSSAATASATATTTEPTTKSEPTATTVPTTTAEATTSTAVSTTTTESTPDSTPSEATEASPAPVLIRLRIDRRVDDAATEGFASSVRAVLTDERGWTRAGFEFTFSEARFDYSVVLAEGPEVDALCLPYDTFGRFSCQNGPVVALNADRWRTAVDGWPASLDAYRTMLINHEVGHLLGQHHPASRCRGDGQPAPVMAQQSSGVAPCTANPWPLQWEITCARQGVEPLAPPYERDITLTCGPDGPVG